LYRSACLRRLIDGTAAAATRSWPSSLSLLVLPIPSGPLGRSPQAVHERLSPFSLGGEVFSKEFSLVASTVPADADLSGIKALLVRGQEDG
jgi:hypothetical protein